MKLVFKDNKFMLFENDEFKKIDEGIGSFTVGSLFGAGLSKVIGKKVNINDYNLKLGDKVSTVTVDDLKRKQEYEGILTMKNNVPYVVIKKGPVHVGELVKWTPSWTKK